MERLRPAPTGPITVEASSPPITAKDLDARIAALTDPRTEGRGTGTPGEAAAADWLGRAFVAAGLVPAGDAWEHVFEFTAGVSLGPDNRFEVDGAAAELDRDWRPLAFSRAGAFEASDVVFVGYGLVAPAAGRAPVVPARDEHRARRARAEVPPRRPRVLGLQHPRRAWGGRQLA